MCIRDRAGFIGGYLVLGLRRLCDLLPQSLEGIKMCIRDRHWDYAQSIAPDIFLSLGKVLLAVETVLSIVLLLFRIPVYISVAAGMCIGVAFLVFGFYKTDSKIKGKFHNGSN